MPALFYCIVMPSTTPLRRAGDLTLRRRVAFSAGHAYWLPDRSEDENRTLFGKWASPWGHGHNYVAEVAVAGPVDPITGMVVNITEVDAALKAAVGPLADRHLNHEVDAFRTTPPTLENIVRHVVGAFRARFGSGAAHLTRMTVYEAPSLWATWQEEIGEMLLTRTFDFAAAHRLHAPKLSDEENLALFGKCNNPHGHGHNYGVEVTVAGTPDPVTGMLVDLAALDAVLDREIMQRYDHRHLNLDTEDFRQTNPTSENLTLAIWKHLEDKIPAPARLWRVVVRETDRNYFEYTGENPVPSDN